MNTAFYQNNLIPRYIIEVLEILHAAGYEGYLVGGCVRDILMNRKPKDWDITTNARPDQIQKLYPKTVYENDFGMVAVINEDEEAESPLRSVEITTYRSETTYSDNRHPDSIEFTDNIEEDLKRRDFTINATAYDPIKDTIVDLFNGQGDISNKVIRAVGDPNERFIEDALRMIRAVRFVAQLGFNVSSETEEAIMIHVKRLESVSAERVRDEMVKLIMSKNPSSGLIFAHSTGVLAYVSRELSDGAGIQQNKSHIYDVFTHNVNALQHAAEREYPLHVRLAALFHDVGKPKTRRFDKTTGDYTFYGHEVVGARIVKKTLERLKFPKTTVEKVTKLVRYHMFFSDPDQITLSAVRRIIVNVGEDLIWDLIHVRYADRIGMGRPKEDPYRLRKYESMIEEALRDPISVKMLKMNGDIMIRDLGFTPGPRMGWMLHALLEEVLDDPSKNTEDYMKKRTLELNELGDAELQRLGEAGKERRELSEEEEIKKLRKKHNVN